MSEYAAPGAAPAAPRTARRRRARWGFAALAVLVLVVAGVIAGPMVMRAINPVSAATPTTAVVEGKLVVTTSADGTVEPAVTEEVFAQVGGTVDSVSVTVGDRVKKGETLFVIDKTELQSAVRAARAKLRQADQQVWGSKQQVEQAEYQVLQAENRLEELESRPATRPATDAEIEEAKKGVEVAQTGLKSAQKGLLSARSSYDNASRDYEAAVADLDKVTVTAPIGGVVTAVNVVEGGSVSSGSGASGAAASGTSGGSGTSSAGGASSASVVIADTSELIVTVAVNEVDIADLRAGQEATVTLDALDDLELAATVSWVSPNAVSDGNVSTYEVRLELASQDDRLRSGMTATADIVTAKVEDALLVPKSSVKVDGMTKYVTVVAQDGTEEHRTVTTGLSDDTNIQVKTGLSAGERIATASSTSEEDSLRAGFMPPSPGGLQGGGPAGGSRPPGMGGN